MEKTKNMKTKKAVISAAERAEKTKDLLGKFSSLLDEVSDHVENVDPSISVFLVAGFHNEDPALDKKMPPMEGTTRMEVLSSMIGTGENLSQNLFSSMENNGDIDDIVRQVLHMKVARMMGGLFSGPEDILSSMMANQDPIGE